MLLTTAITRGPDGDDPVIVAPHLGLVAVADPGTPGPDGRAGARLALELVRAHLEKNTDALDRFRRHPTEGLRTSILDLLTDAFTRAAQEVFAFARRRPGVGVALDAVLLLGTEAFVAHAGDGRVYLVRDGVVHQLTVDVSRSGPDSDVGNGGSLGVGGAPPGLLGAAPRVDVERLCVELAEEDRFVVCGAALPRVVPELTLHARMTNEHLSALAGAFALDAGPVPIVAGCVQVGSGAPSAADTARAKLAVLAPMQLFAHCTERELRVVAQATHPRRLPAGVTVFEEGQPGTDLYLVISGRVDVLKGGRRLAELHPGTVFGEMALLDEPSRSATARTAADAELMVITRSAFFQMLRAHPPLAVKILWNLNLRLSASLRSTSAHVAELEAALEAGRGQS